MFFHRPPTNEIIQLLSRFFCYSNLFCLFSFAWEKLHNGISTKVKVEHAGFYSRVEEKFFYLTWPSGRGPKAPTLNSIRQTDVDTLMIRTQSRVRVRVWVRVRVRVRVRVIHLNQTGIRHKILGGVGVRVMHSRSDASSSNPTYSILNCFFP